MRLLFAAAAVCLFVPLVAVTGGCGESEERIARERAEAAKIARQDERLKQLERDLKRQRSSPAPAGGSPQPSPAQPRTPPPAPPGDGSVGTWPAGVEAYTVILASEATRSGAEAKAREAANAGEAAGVLRSDDYSSLRPGYWVAYVGQSSTADEAGREAARLKGLGYPSAYPRLVSDG